MAAQGLQSLPGNYNYKPFRSTPSVQRTCLRTQVYIENWATAALYIYTPYRPNQAALNAQWGLGDGCSSYGNRNFFMLYSSWFGSPTLSAGTPTGEVKELWTVNNGIRLWGWALDPDSITSAVQIHVRFGTSWAAATADQPNPNGGRCTQCRTEPRLRHVDHSSPATRGNRLGQEHRIRRIGC